MLSASLIWFDVVCTSKYLNMGAFNSLNHPLRFFCLVLFLCLSVCLSYWCCSSAKPLPVSCFFFYLCVCLFLCVYSSLFCLLSAVCLWPSLMSTPWWPTGASLGKVSHPYCRTATVQLTWWLLSLSFFFPPDHPPFLFAHLLWFSPFHCLFYSAVTYIGPNRSVCGPKQLNTKL